MVKPLKRFGQNYLSDKNIVDKIVKVISPKENDCLIEIGPGSGSLTSGIYSFKKNFTAIEIDKRVIDDLKEKFPDVKFVQGDFLDFNLASIDSNEIKIAGNIPYNITSPIIFKLFENRNIVSEAVLMVQYEVAKRISAIPRTKDYGILSVLCQAYAEVIFCFKVSANVFYPKPNVDSAVIKLKFFKNDIGIVDDKIFIQTVKSAFGNRRKTLRNSLANSIFASINFNNMDFDFKKRAEELTVDEFKLLSNYIYNQLKKSDDL